MTVPFFLSLAKEMLVRVSYFAMVAPKIILKIFRAENSVLEILNPDR